MTKQIILTGTTANDRSGDPLRTAFTKINQNFTELYDSTTYLPPEITLTINNTNNTTPEDNGALHVLGGVTIERALTVNEMVHVGNGAVNNQFMNPVIVAKSSGSTYVQSALINSDGHGSADLVAYADNGTEEGGWIDMGIAGSVFDDPNYSITDPGDGYIFVQGVDDGISHGELVLCTGSAGIHKDIVFGTGGYMRENTRMTLDHGLQCLHIIMDTDVTTESNGAFWLYGGAKIEKTLNVGGSYVASTVDTSGGTDQATAVALDLSKQIHKLWTGTYSLANGTEGQVLRVVRKSGIDNATLCRIYVSKSRIAGVEYINNFIDPFANGSDIVTFIFTDGAWQAQGGLWD